MVSGSDVGEGTHSGGETPVGEGRQVEGAESPLSGEWRRAVWLGSPEGHRGARGGSMTLGKLWGLRRVSGLKFVRTRTRTPEG